MPRQARLRIAEGDGYYHLYCRTTGGKFDMPFSREGASERFADLLKFYSGAYYCQVLAWCVMGNHYHLVMRFDGQEARSRRDLMRRARMLYPAAESAKEIKAWSDEKWCRFEARLHDVSEFMRNLHMAYARWHNQAFEARGRFWAERFQSTILMSAEAVEDCMLYVELNPIRADLVTRPEDWKASSFHLRDLGLDAWMAPLADLLEAPDEATALRQYRAKLYSRGAVPTKEEAGAISEEVLRAEEARGFAQSGVFTKRVRHFTRGLVLGSKGAIQEWLTRLRESGRYRRRKNPMENEVGMAFSLR